MQLSNIKLDGEIYPRDAHDDQIVSSYRVAIDYLPPIIVTHEGWLVDGYHRYLAYIAEGKQEIAVEVVQLEKDQILVDAIRRNAKHGKQLERREKERLAQRIYPQLSVAELAELLSVTERTVSGWTAAQRAEEKEQQIQRVWEAWLACESENEIAEREGIDRTTVNEWVRKVVENGKSSDFHNPPDSFQLYDIWRFNKADERYGNANYPGRVPGQIIENLLWYYTEPGDAVLDPMAGGGTTLDVCKAMGRRYLGYDLQPSRPDIKQHDARRPIPLPDSIKFSGTSVKLAFLDPPYWKQRRDKYGVGSISDDDLESFYSAVLTIIRNCVEVISSGYVALIIGPTQDNRVVTDHAIDIARLVELPLARRYIVPYTTQQAKAYHVTSARKNRYSLKLYRDLLIWGKD